MITHQMDVIREVCEKVAIIEAGKLVEDGNVVDIFNHPKSAAGKRLIIGENAPISAKTEKSQVSDEVVLRAVFTENLAFEPVVANMILRNRRKIMKMYYCYAGNKKQEIISPARCVTS